VQAYELALGECDAIAAPLVVAMGVVLRICRCLGAAYVGTGAVSRGRPGVRVGRYTST